MHRPLLILAIFLVSLTQLSAQFGTLETLQAGRYTRQGSEVLVETGVFISTDKKGFVAFTSISYEERSLGLPASSITAINGKVVALKTTIDLYNQINPGFLDNYSFSKQSYAAVGGDVYIVTLAGGGNTSAPTATVKASKTSLTEGPKKSSSAFIITLNKAPTEDIVVLFKLSGSAKSGSDYLSSNNLGSARVKKGKKSAQVTVSTLNDTRKESKEKVVFTILAHGGYKLGKKKSATVNILDDDR